MTEPIFIILLTFVFGQANGLFFVNDSKKKLPLSYLLEKLLSEALRKADVMGKCVCYTTVAYLCRMEKFKVMFHSDISI